MVTTRCYKSSRSGEGPKDRSSPVPNSAGRTRGRFRLSIAAGHPLLLGGGATTSTPSQPVSASNRVSGGYSEVRLDSDRYRVTVAGNMVTSRDKVAGYLLYCAAERTTQQGETPKTNRRAFDARELLGPLAPGSRGHSTDLAA